MGTEEAETPVNDSFSVTIPAAVGRDVDLEPGDRFRWRVTDDGQLAAELARERHGAADSLDPVDIGETDAVEITESYDWS
ncbi:AbrB family transcriptional regulator [Halobacteriales archaeon QS_1_68_17]|nr:MAG: AbrB family transcriptional regulator [Halobacteriales archaeon QS_1_68_17]